MNTNDKSNILQKSSTHQIVLYGIIIIHLAIFEYYYPFSQISTIVTATVLLWRYILILLLLYEVNTISKLVPTDPILAGKIASEDCNQEELVLCILCNSLVYKDSYHCFRCSRCAHQFDHHCKFLNCCIGGDNYVPFLRLLFTFIFYCVDNIVLVAKSQNFEFKITHIGISTILGGLFSALLIFHIYLNCWLGMTTLQYLIPGLRKLKHRKLQEQIDEFKDETRDK